LKSQGYALIAGVDEVGRGAWAGPLVAAAVILPEKRIYRLRDSKLLTSLEREKLAQKIKEEAREWKIAFVSNKLLDNFGLSLSTILAYKKAVRGLKQRPDYLLTDYYKIPRFSIPHSAITKGDMKVASIAAASIIAKVSRDRYMRKIGRRYPIFEFEKNKGYPSPAHKAALKKYGPCFLHRRCFRPIREFVFY